MKPIRARAHRCAAGGSAAGSCRAPRRRSGRLRPARSDLTPCGLLAGYGFQVRGLGISRLNVWVYLSRGARLPLTVCQGPLTVLANYTRYVTRFAKLGPVSSDRRGTLATCSTAHSTAMRGLQMRFARKGLRSQAMLRPSSKLHHAPCSFGIPARLDAFARPEHQQATMAWVQQSRS